MDWTGLRPVRLAGVQSGGSVSSASLYLSRLCTQGEVVKEKPVNMPRHYLLIGQVRGNRWVQWTGCGLVLCP